MLIKKAFDCKQLSRFRQWPWRKWILDIMQRRCQRREVSGKDAYHPIVVDPFNAQWRVDLWGEVGGKETVTVQTTRGHQDEDTEGGVAETKSLGWLLCKH